MANPYSDDRDRWGRGERSGPHDDPARGSVERGRDEVRSWFGDDEAARRRRLDERERDRWEAESRQRWGGGAWGNPRSYSSDREYGDRGYGDWASTRERFDRPDRADWADRDAAWRDRPAMPAYTGVGHGHYAEPGYIGSHEYDRQTYGGPYPGQRQGAREWSSVEGWRVPGPHTGRGPRGYQRTDERIREEINERLTAHGLIDATEVECGVRSGEVTLTGFVDSRAAKRAAEDLAEDVYGVREVHNELRVRSHASDTGVGRTSVLGLTESQVQSTHSSAGPAADHGRPRTRT